MFVCFFFNFFWGCDSTIYYDSYVQLDNVVVSFNSCTTNNCEWNAFQLMVYTEGEITRHSVDPSMAWNQGGGTRCLATNVETRLIQLEHKITKYDVSIIPQNISLTESFISEEGIDFSTYIDDINEGLPPQKGNSIASPTEDGRMIYDRYRFPETFHFQEAPEELKDKDFQIVVWLKTENGQEFSDTTEVIRLTL